jgi:hypothetical protein
MLIFRHSEVSKRFEREPFHLFRDGVERALHALDPRLLARRFLPYRSAMRIAFTVGHLLTSVATLPAQSNLVAAPSSRATSTVTLTYREGEGPAGGASFNITLDYGQPHLRGRTLHTDSLVPYDRPWRTGANAQTTLSTDVDLVIGGQNVPKGKYVVMTQPGRTGWKLFLQKEAGQNPGEYFPANDVARVDLRRRELPTPVESLTMSLIPAAGPGPARGVLLISWGRSEVSTDWTVR